MTLWIRLSERTIHIGECESMIQIAICNDEIEDRKEIYTLIQQYELSTQEEYHIELFESGEHLLQSGFKPNILILDIIMNGCDGIQIGEEIKNLYTGTIIIYITNTSGKISEALNRIHSFGYLVKPVIKKDLFRLMSDAVEQVKRNNNVPYVTFLSENKAVINLAITDIYYFEYNNRKIKIVAKDKTYTCIKEKISDIAEKMQPYGFAMSHQSFVVNLYQVEAISEQMLLIKNGTKVYLAQKRASAIRKQLMQIAKQQP